MRVGLVPLSLYSKRALVRLHFHRLIQFQRCIMSVSAPPDKRINGTQLAGSIRQSVAERVRSLKEKHTGFQPRLSIIQVGEDGASSTYIRMKSNSSAQCGIRADHIKLPAGSTEAEITNKIRALNEDPSVDGILVQLPLGDHIDSEAERRITEEVTPRKDVDGFHTINIGQLASRACNPQFVPCTPAGILRLLETVCSNDLSGKFAVVMLSLIHI